MQKKYFHVFLSITVLIAAAVMDITTQAYAATVSETDGTGEVKKVDPQSMSSLMSGKHPVIFYIPNRIFDILDILRFRVRIGPGVSVGARVTELADVFFGGHATGFVGLRGARGKPEIPWPFGVENNGGLEVSVIDTTSKDKNAPCTDPLELSIEAQVAIVGFNIGLELFEVVDLAAGLIFIDLRGDDF